ncbi:MAG: hypothetical protein GC157_15465 [Frankiales bacterium]|nr:hypothetical protein [Frankiales bacterium]
MTTYLITFAAGAMDHVPDDELPAVADAAHAVAREAIAAGVYVLAGGLVHAPASVVTPDGAVTEGTPPGAVSGITVVDVTTREDALAWAAKVAAACRCAQEVRELGSDPELDAMLRGASAG